MAIREHGVDDLKDVELGGPRAGRDDLDRANRIEVAHGPRRKVRFLTRI